MMLLNEIIQNISVKQVVGSTRCKVHSIRFDSRRAGPGDLFVAVTGTNSNGHDYIGSVAEQGVKAIVCEALPADIYPEVTYIVTDNSHQALGQISSAFYDHPSGKLTLVGVTGTNGKTSVATLLFYLFLNLGYKVGLLSTIVNRINQREIPATHTTPDTVQLNELLAAMVAEGCSYCFMEVSSHAIDQQRIAGLEFKGGIFTNLTHDHLDYHKTFPSYLKAKKKFFDDLPGSAFAIVNKDDKNGLVMVQNTRAAISSYSLQSMADFRCKVLENSFEGLLLNLDGEEVWFRMIGKFNASNLLAVYGTARLLGQEKSAILENLSKSAPVSGRFNHIRSAENITFIIDYAHTPDALKNVLETIQDIRGRNEKLITVVGAGGNRDKSKRPIMASIAASLSDHLILTSDNPRDEDPLAILQEMKQGIQPDQVRKVLIIEQREEAIKTASILAKPGDIVLIAGKGHENYQEIRGVRYHFDDMEVVKGVISDNRRVIV